MELASDSARMADRIIPTLALLFAAGCMQRPPPIPLPAIGPSEAPLLKSAMESRISLGRNRDGRLVPIGHCRYAREGCDRRLSEFSTYLIAASQQQRLDTWLLAAMAIKESGLNPFARGPVGELGILQINPRRSDSREVRFVYDSLYRDRCKDKPGACQKEIVSHAARVLSEALNMCHGRIIESLGAYNTGRCGGNDEYADRVLQEREDLLKAVGIDMRLASAAAENHPL